MAPYNIPLSMFSVSCILFILYVSHDYLYAVLYLMNFFIFHQNYGHRDAPPHIVPFIFLVIKLMWFWIDWGHYWYLKSHQCVVTERPKAHRHTVPRAVFGLWKSLAVRLHMVGYIRLCLKLRKSCGKEGKIFKQSFLRGCSTD